VIYLQKKDKPGLVFLINEKLEINLLVDHE
jgi:hypothetical protein